MMTRKLFCGWAPVLRANKAVRLLLLLSLASAQAFAAAPEWLRNLAHQPAGSYSDEIGAEVLLDEQVITVLENGDRTIMHRRAVRILRPKGRDDATPLVYFDAQTKILSLNAWSIDPRGQEYELR